MISMMRSLNYLGNYLTFIVIFFRFQAPVQPGSLDSEAGIFSMTFDNSGTRLITCEADKTIKVYKEDDSATEESHPINWKPDILKRRKF